MTRHKSTLPLFWVSRVICYYYAECRCADCRYAGRLGAKLNNAYRIDGRTAIGNEISNGREPKDCLG